ncbi:hypothetical protein F10086_95 [Staphylococcus phage vB_SauM_JDF86]|nr:hypothetical protein F10086_95 [Staphylococcus phage vB_SauM_JDF86]
MKGEQMKLYLQNIYTYVEFGGNEETLREVFRKRVHTHIGVRAQGYQFVKAFKLKKWDGYTDFYEFDKDRFPSGLLEQVKELLYDLQNRYTFQFDVVDERSEAFLEPEDVTKEIKLLDKKMGTITLRDYQQEAVEESLVKYNGLINIATNGGKCLSEDSMILTTKGYKSLQDIFKEKNISTDSKKQTIDVKYPLINRYGNVEYTSHFTKNGVKPTKVIKTNKGIELNNTYNHPVLVREGFSFIWKNTEDIQQGDILVSRVGDNYYGNDNTIKNTEDAYAIGCMIADSYLGSYSRLSFSNDKEEILNKVSDFWSTFSNKDTYYDTHKKSKGITIHLHDKKESNKFHSKYGIGYGVAKDKRVPKSVMQSSRDIQLSFLSGYLECESSIDDKNLEVTSASEKLLKDIQLMLMNIGVISTLSDKIVKGYEHNYYGRLIINRIEMNKLLPLLTFKTEQRIEQSKKALTSNTKIKSSYGNKIEGSRKILTIYRDSLEIPKTEFKKYISRDSISIERLREVIRNYPEGNSSIKHVFEKLTDSNLLYQEVVEVMEGEEIPTFDVCMPKTHSFISNSVVNHNTEIASGIIQELLPYLEKGETIAFFTHSKEIFHQTADRMKERLNIPIGKIGAGSFDIKQVNVVMIPTVNANLKDPGEGVTLTQKQMIYKKVALQILPKLSTTPNKRTMLFLMLEQMKVKTKADQAFKEELTKIYQDHKTDSELMMKLNTYNVKYQEILRKKNEKKYDKYYKMKDFLQSIACFIGDEFHHAKSDTWYTSLLQCENALYKIGLTGSIDHSDPLTVQRLKALCGEILIKVSNDYLIERGISARPTINSIPIANPTNLEEENQYQVAYDKGIVNNEFRNTLVAKITEKCYHDNKGILIIVNFLQHGNNISELLESYDIPHEFIYGDLETDKRKQYLSDMKSGKLKVLIATSLIDEGVDISGINTLIIAAGGKSLRQVLQRIGRALRRKEEDNTTQIYDFIDMTNKFLYKHYLERRSIYDNENFEVREIK